MTDCADQIADDLADGGVEDCPCGGEGCRLCNCEIAEQERAEDIGDRMREEREDDR